MILLQILGYLLNGQKLSRKRKRRKMLESSDSGKIRKNSLEEIPLENVRTARRIARAVESKVNYREWVKVQVEFRDELREDRCADCTIDMKIRLFRNGRDVGTLLHEMAHNSINCLWELMLKYPDVKYKSSGYDDSHFIYFDLLLDELIEIYEGLKW
jgi:hypothetical protein